MTVPNPLNVTTPNRKSLSIPQSRISSKLNHTRLVSVFKNTPSRPSDFPPPPNQNERASARNRSTSIFNSPFKARPSEINKAKTAARSVEARATLNGGKMLKSSMMRSVSDDRNGNQNLEVGDTVDVPGGMHGTIKFIGEVKGKKGTFAGVELAREWAARGKNDGDVEGKRYFTTSIKGAGIFLPSNKAYRRLSPNLSSVDSMPPTPTSPPSATYNVNGKLEKPSSTPSAISGAPKFSQSVGPGRVPSPTLKAKRPSLPRPDSPQRKAQNALSTPQTRPSLGKPNFSKSMISGPRHAPSPTPNKFGGSVRGAKDLTGDPGKKLPTTPKPAIRKPTGVRPTSPNRNVAVPPPPPLGPEAMFDEEPDNFPIPGTNPQPQARNSQQASRPTSNQGQEIQSLRKQLEERDRQLEKYATDLDEMQNSISELQTMSPKPASITNRSSRGSAVDSLDAPSLRALVREKDEKISTLIREFDSHRADFRETIDILEHTSDETNRHYEDRLTSLEAQLREQNDREGDVQSVAEQLLMLEKHVEELEEGLEDSRRGESEARAEVEHLRGEVERGKAEMRREREKAANARAYGGGDSPSDSRTQREIAHRDNEINGLKAIIHSLSRDPASGSPTSPKSSRRSKQDNARHSQNEAQIAEERRMREKMEREIKDLQNIVDRKTYREEELEHEVSRLRKHTSQISSAPSNHTAVPPANRSSNNSNNNNNNNSHYYPPTTHSRNQSWRDRSAASPTIAAGAATAEDNQSSTTHLTDNSALWCEMCEVSGHDILHCTTMSSPPMTTNTTTSAPNGPLPSSGKTVPPPPTNGLSRTPTYPSVNDFPAPATGGGGIGGGNIGPAPKSRMPNPLLDNSGMAPGKGSGVIDASKWCALCERDGHDSVDCPFDEDDF